MTNIKQHHIKAVIDYRRHTAAQVVTDATNIGTALFANLDKFKDAPTPPPVDQATLKKETDILVSVNAAAENGGKKELAQQKHQKEVVVKLIILLGHWVEANCKDDMTTFLSTGFQATASTKSKTPPESESVRKIVPGSVSGQMFVWLVKFRDAASYELRWAPVPAGGGTPTAWSMQPLSNVKAPVVITGLTPGTAYVFQARAVVKNGYSDYSQPITKMAV
jgi:Fibronectin type III domain